MPLPKDYAARKALPLFTFLTEYFPDAFIEIVKVAVAGNVQHNPGEKLHWARGKSMDQLNTAMRHMMDHGMGDVYDSEPPEVLAAIGEDGTMHLAKAAWRLMAEIQLLCEARDARRDDCERMAASEQPVDIYEAYQLTPDSVADNVARRNGAMPELAAAFGVPPRPNAFVPGRLNLACGCFGYCKGVQGCAAVIAAQSPPIDPMMQAAAQDEARHVVPGGTGPRDPAGKPYNGLQVVADALAYADAQAARVIDPDLVGEFDEAITGKRAQD